VGFPGVSDEVVMQVREESKVMRLPPLRHWLAHFLEHHAVVPVGHIHGKYAKVSCV